MYKKIFIFHDIYAGANWLLGRGVIKKFYICEPSQKGLFLLLKHLHNI